jgi:transcriptional regulator with XRE-family HTH domain
VAYGEIIKRAREAKRWTQDELAVVLSRRSPEGDISRSTLSLWENEAARQGPIKPWQVNALCEALHIPAEDLLAGLGYRLSPQPRRMSILPELVDILQQWSRDDQLALLTALRAASAVRTPRKDEARDSS